MAAILDTGRRWRTLDFLWTLNFYRFWPIMQIRKKGGWNLKKSSPLKLLSQSQPNFAEMILEWSSPPDTFLEENHPTTISSKFCSYWANGFRQRFLWEFPIGSYVKLSSAVAAILVGVLKFIKMTKATIVNFFLPKLSSFIDWCCYYTQVSYTGSWEPLVNFRNVTSLVLTEENHPMTISSKFCSYWANGFRQKDFYGNFP
jgi:hypothetical protein